MGKASSNKKVARAAGIGGGRTRRGRTPWAYFGFVGLVVILGITGTITSRDRRLSQINGQGESAPTVGTVWNEGYAVYACGKFLPAITHAKDPEGITTGNGDGIIHIAPTVKAAAGKNAVLGKFADATGMKLNAAELQVPGGKLYQDGNSCEGKPGHVYVKQFAFAGDKTGKLYNGDTTSGQLPKLDPRQVPLADQELVTIAFVPANDASSIPPPPAYVNTNLSKVAASSTTTTTTPGSSSTTAPSSSPTTTSKASTATTVKQ
jgi:hypothetical protein